MSEIDNPTLMAEGIYAKFSNMFEPYLEEVGIDKAALSDPDVLIPLTRHARLMEVTAEKSGDPYFGMHMGLKVQTTDMGAIGYVMDNSPTVGAALRNFARYLAAYTRGCFFELQTDGELAYYNFSYTLPELGVMDRRQEAECTLALVMTQVRSISGGSWSPVEVWFEHPRPETITEHKRVFGAPVEFGRSINRLIFNASFLEKPVRAAQPRLFAVIEEHLQHVIENQNHEYDLVNQVSNLVARELSNGVPTIDWVSEQLIMTKRTLQRRLAERGIGFSEIVDNVRRSMAVQYVEKSEIPLTEISFLLGYSHLSAFCRSFKRWMGATPQKVRGQSDA